MDVQISMTASLMVGSTDDTASFRQIPKMLCREFSPRQMLSGTGGVDCRCIQSSPRWIGVRHSSGWKIYSGSIHVVLRGAGDANLPKAFPSSGKTPRFKRSVPDLRPDVIKTKVADQAAKISRIEVRGNTRVDVQTVRDNLSSTAGKPFSKANIDAAAGTGLFSDARISQPGGILIIHVNEHPIVDQVIFQASPTGYRDVRWRIHSIRRLFSHQKPSDGSGENQHANEAHSRNLHIQTIQEDAIGQRTKIQATATVMPERAENPNGCPANGEFVCRWSYPPLRGADSSDAEHVVNSPERNCNGRLFKSSTVIEILGRK